MGEGSTFGREGRKKYLTVLFSNFYMSCADGAFVDCLRVQTDSCPTRTAHKGAQTPPLCELPAWKSFGGLGLKASDTQRFARGRPFGRYKVQCKSFQIARSLQVAVTKWLFLLNVKFGQICTALCYLPNGLPRANRCLFEALRPSPPNVGGEIHKRASPWKSSCAPPRVGA